MLIKISNIKEQIFLYMGSEVRTTHTVWNFYGYALSEQDICTVDKKVS